jgi:UDP-N-acetylmuramate--alanine ligase
MISTAFISADQDPTITVGGELSIINGNYKIGTSKFLITEACEYVESFLELSPKVSVVLNVEADHLDYYKDINHIKSSFQKFLNKLPEDGVAILNADDKNSYGLFNNTKSKIISFGINNTANYMAQNIIFERNATYYNLYKDGNLISEVILTVPGMHNIYNSLACIAVCDLYKLDLNIVIDSLKDFAGAKRRFEKKGTLNGAEIYDDYAHHPSEIKATLSAAKNRNMKKVWCVFQPHTYSRTKALLTEFASAFYDADNVIITDIYAAREKNNGEISAENLVEEIKKTSNNAIYIKEFNDIENYLKEHISDGEILLTIGAGNVYKIGENLISK